MNDHTPAPDPGQSAAPGDERRVAAEIAQLLHTLGQPLTAINSYAQTGNFLLDSGAQDSERMRELFSKILQQADRTFAISRQLKEAAAKLGHDPDQGDAAHTGESRQTTLGQEPR